MTFCYIAWVWVLSLFRIEHNKDPHTSPMKWHLMDLPVLLKPKNIILNFEWYWDVRITFSVSFFFANVFSNLTRKPQNSTINLPQITFFFFSEGILRGYIIKLGLFFLFLFFFFIFQKQNLFVLMTTFGFVQSSSFSHLQRKKPGFFILSTNTYTGTLTGCKLQISFKTYATMLKPLTLT